VQTASAEAETSRPVTRPHAERTQSKAVAAIAEDAELLHWQAYSVETHPTTEAADSMQGIWYTSLVLSEVIC
jgi:hypothetical protein